MRHLPFEVFKYLEHPQSARKRSNVHWKGFLWVLKMIRYLFESLKTVKDSVLKRIRWIKCVHVVEKEKRGCPWGFLVKKSNSSHAEGQIVQISDIFFQADFYSKNIKIVGAGVNCPYPFLKQLIFKGFGSWHKVQPVSVCKSTHQVENCYFSHWRSHSLCTKS